jgi:signal peptidase I
LARPPFAAILRRERRRAAGPEDDTMPIHRWIRDNRGLLALLLLFGLVRTAVADYNPVPSGSMHPTILEGDVVLVNRLAYNVKLPLTDLVLARTGEPQRGDIVTFSSPKDGRRLIKRVIGLPGDRIAMRARQLEINGRPAHYTPLGPVRDAARGALRLEEDLGGPGHVIQWLPERANAPDFGPLTVPPDAYLVLGDNRDDSADSRYIGFVPRQLLIGRAERILVSVPLDEIGWPRWERFGRPFAP